MPTIRRVVLDILKPHEPKLATFTEKLSESEEIDGVTSKLVDIEEDVRTIRVTIEGEDLDMDTLEAKISDLSGSIHSVDEVSCGEYIVEDAWLTDR